MNKIVHGDSLDILKTLEAESVDVVVTDPPYGYSFMGKAWDKALPDIGIFKETLRVLKPGAFAFVMSAPRSDVCSRMAIMLEDAGFNIAFTPIYWTYAGGFPKAMNIGKMVDKRNGKDFNPGLKQYLLDAKERSGRTLREINLALGYSDKGGNFASDLFSFKKDNRFLYPTVAQWKTLKRILGLDDSFDDLIEREEAEREILASKSKLNTYSDQGYASGVGAYQQTTVAVTAPATDAAKALDGSYGGFQPKPAVEVVIVAMKPLSEKTYVDQALKNGKGITWLDDCRVPTNSGDDIFVKNPHTENKGASDIYGEYSGAAYNVAQGRFPANLIVSDDVLNDGIERHTHAEDWSKKKSGTFGSSGQNVKSDSGSYSRFFSLDAWAQTLPFLAVPKASKGEKTAGGTVECGHPTVKPLKLMSYLITLGSRPGDVVLDSFAGSGTTAVAAKQLGRRFIAIEKEKEYCDIMEARLAAIPDQLL